MAKAIPNPADYGMVGVSKEAFFAVLGRLDVHPSISGERHCPVMGYLSRWKTPHGQVLGATVGGGHASEAAYMVTHEFFNKHREALLATS